MSSARSGTAPATWQAPLAIHVVRHDDTLGEQALAEDLYSFLARDPMRPLHRGLGIPVWLWNGVENARSSLEPVPATRTVYVPLVSPRMVLQPGDFLERLRSVEGDDRRVIPVSLDGAAIKPPLNDLNFIRAHEADEAGRPAFIREWLVHELCRMLLGSVPAAEARREAVPAPVRMFISHAKLDGLGVAEALQTFIHQSSDLDTFFDAASIAPGYGFAEQIREGLRDGVMVAVQSDAYASREWCRREVLIAKELGRPLVVINHVASGEVRGFPYLGNVPTVRWDPDADAATIRQNCQRVITLALRELLRVLYFIEERQAYGPQGPGETISAYPPELCTLAAHGRRDPLKRILYADPPLGDEETALLQAVSPGLETATPLLAHRDRLRGWAVALSVSESPDMGARGWAEPQLDDFTVELSRYLLASGATLAYGGDLRAGGFTESILELVRAHDAAGDAGRVHVYLFWPYHREKLTETKEVEVHPAVHFHRGPRPDGVPDETTLEGLKGDPATAALCLTAMRRQMTGEVHARVLMGGRLAGYMGLVPGVAEEALLALEAGQPTFLVGAFGGAAEAVLHALGGRPSALDAIPDAAPLVARLRALGTGALRNGLSDEENRQLFATRMLREAVELVLRGLCRLQDERPPQA